MQNVGGFGSRIGEKDGPAAAGLRLLRAHHDGRAAQTHVVERDPIAFVGAEVVAAETQADFQFRVVVGCRYIGKIHCQQLIIIAEREGGNAQSAVAPHTRIVGRVVHEDALGGGFVFGGPLHSDALKSLGGGGEEQRVFAAVGRKGLLDLYAAHVGLLEGLVVVALRDVIDGGGTVSALHRGFAPQRMPLREGVAGQGRLEAQHSVGVYAERGGNALQRRVVGQCIVEKPEVNKVGGRQRFEVGRELCRAAHVDLNFGLGAARCARPMAEPVAGLWYGPRCDGHAGEVLAGPGVGHGRHAGGGGRNVYAVEADVPGGGIRDVEREVGGGGEAELAAQVLELKTGALRREIAQHLHVVVPLGHRSGAAPAGAVLGHFGAELVADGIDGRCEVRRTEGRVEQVAVAVDELQPESAVVQ